MLLLNKRFAVVAIFVALVFTLLPSTLRAEEAAEAAKPTPSEQAPTPVVESAPVPSKTLDADAPKPITTISEVVKSFKATIDTNDEGTGRLKISGLIHKDCLEHIAIRMDEFDDEKQVYPVRVIFYNYKDQGGKEVPHSCSVEKTRGCDRYNCAEINTAVNGFGRNVVSGFNTPLERTGKVKLRADDLRYPEGDPDAIKDVDLVRGGLEYQSPETLTRLAEEEEKANKKEEMLGLCKQAQAGNKGALERLKDMGANPEILQKLGPIVLEKEMVDLETAVDKASSLKDLKGLISDIQEFGLANDKMRDRSARALEMLADKALELETDSERETSANKNIHNQFVTAENALKSAKKLSGGKDIQLRMKTNQVKLRHAEWASNVGDSFFRDIANKTFRTTYNDVNALARQSKDPDVEALRKVVQEKAKPRVLPTLYDSSGYMVAGLTGNELDQNFVNANNSALGVNDQIKQLLGSQSNYWMPPEAGRNGRF